MKVDTVIIGSGVSGLTCAALLAKAGKQVLILERNARPGGALRRFARHGIPFDIGFHYTGCLGRGEILRAIWRYLDIWPRLTVRRFPAQGHDLLYLPGSGKEVRAFFSEQDLREELHQCFPGEQQAITGYFHAIKQIGRSLPFYNLELALTPFLRGFGLRQTGLAQFLRGLTADLDLQATLASPAFLHGVPPEDASVAVHAMVAYAFFSGAYAIDGGGQAIIEAFLAVLAGAGAEVRTNHEVQAIQVRDGQVVGVLAAGQMIAAPQVIYSGHPAKLLELVPKTVFRPAFRHRLQDLRSTGSMLVVFGAVSDPADFPELTWRNCYALPAGLDILACGPGQAGCDRALLMTAPGRRDLEPLASRAGYGIILMRPVAWEEVSHFDQGVRGKRPTAYNTWKLQKAGEILTQAARLWGPACKRIEPLAIGSPLTFRDELASPQGGIYGPRHSISQSTPGARTRLPGLWLTGQGTLMPGVMGASLAGLITAGEILGLETLWEEVRQWA